MTTRASGQPRDRRPSPNHKADVPFFTTHVPRAWDLDSYLASSTHPPNRTPAQIFARWKTALSQISKCRVARCCSNTARHRADLLLQMYKGKGMGSDKMRGKRWVSAREAEAARVAQQSSVYGDNNTTTNTNTTINGPLITVTGSSEEWGGGGDNRTVDEKHDDDQEKDGDDDDYDESSDEDSDAVLTAAFERTYADFTTSQKWHLSSGRTVEDIIYNCYFSLDEDPLSSKVVALVRDWTLDLSNETMRSWFRPEEWKEICESVPKLPKPGEAFANSLKRFYSVKTTEELRHVLRTTDYLPPDTVYDREKHFDLEWADMVLREFLILFDTPSQPLLSPHLEDWYSSQIWSPLLDKGLLSLPRMTLERKEGVCYASTLRRNRQRESAHERHKTAGSRRLDAILRSIEDDYLEFGCMEVARTFRGTTSTKWLTDSKKLVRALRDMLGRLHSAAALPPDKERTKMQVVGVTTAGLTLELCRLIHVGGYVCAIKRERVQQVPTTVAELQSLLLLLAAVVQIKGVVAECVDVVLDSRRKARSEEELLRAIMEGGDEEAEGGAPCRLPWAGDSP